MPVIAFPNLHASILNYYDNLVLSAHAASPVRACYLDDLAAGTNAANKKQRFS